MRRRGLIGVLVLVGLAVGVLPTAAVAAPAKSTSTSQGLTISPAVLQVTLGATQPQASYDLSLTNHTASVQNLHLSLIDFGTLDETGGLYLIGQPNDFERKYGLAAWMSVSQPVVTVEPGATVTETVTITNQSSLTSGGHYGAVLVKTDTAQPSGDQARVDLKPIITQLLFLNKTGGDIFSLALSSVQRPGGLTGLPSTVDLRFKATGNVHVVPRGIVAIDDPTGREVARGIINEDSDIVLPGAIRQIKVAMRAERTVVVPGRYELVVDYRYDGQDGYTRVSQPFYFVNAALLASWLVIVILAVVLGVVGFRKVRAMYRSGRLLELAGLARERATVGRRRARRRRR